jgi:uncharacterized membrane protein
VSRPGWVAPATFGTAIAGGAISTWLTLAHYTSPRLLACGSSGLVNCERVTTSSQATPFGVPVALLGVLWFVAMGFCCAPKAWRADTGMVRLARLALAVTGMAMVLWLVWAELFAIGAICLWCTVVHLLTFALFSVIVLYGTAPAGSTRSGVDTSSER